MMIERVSAKSVFRVGIEYILTLDFPFGGGGAAAERVITIGSHPAV